MARIFVECTRTARTQLHTGIQRFLRRTLIHAQDAARRQSNLSVIPIIIDGGHFKALSALPPHPYESQQEVELGKLEIVSFRPGDQLLMIDATWYLDAWDMLLTAKNQGALLNFVWHDLIPLHYPELFAPHLNELFSCYLLQVILHADRIIAVSRTVQDQLVRHIKSTAPHRLSTLRLHYNYPGADFFDSKKICGNHEIRSALIEMITAKYNEALLLSVSTIEPRKNHALLLDACEQVWAAGHSPQLCFVGSAGWKMDSLLERLERHPEKGKRLFVWHDLTDAELDYCYRHASCLVYPSMVEGFGLPIAEAGWYSLPVVLSDTSVHREVAGSGAIYFNLNAPEQLTRIINNIAMKQFAFDPTWPEAGRFKSWNQSADRLLQLLLQTHPGAN